MSQQQTVQHSPAAEYTIPAGQTRQFELPTQPRGYAALVGNLRSDQDVKAYLFQGRMGERWLSGKRTPIEVTGAPLDEENDGEGEALGWNNISSDAVLVVANATESTATIWLEMQLVGQI